MGQQVQRLLPAGTALAAAGGTELVGAPGLAALAVGLLAAWATDAALQRRPVEEQAGAVPAVVAAAPATLPVQRRPPRGPAGTSREQAVRDVATLSAASEEVAERFASVASSLQVLRAASDDVAGGTSAVRAGATDALQRAQEAGERVDSLLEASARIGDITGVIASITDQTRTLALNATIEAARAGSAGRGFAVVAGEVKDLASATARAAQSISQQVESVQSGTRAAAEALEGVRAVLTELDRTQGEVAAAVARQGEAGTAIDRDVDEAARGSSRAAALVAARVEAEQRGFVQTALELARDLLDEAGGLVPSGTDAAWDVTGADGRVTRRTLPGLLLAGAPLVRVDDPTRPVPVVDEVKRLVGGTATVFQRLDEAGSMLRVATNVVGPDGRRAVGTVLPVLGPDGTPNPVLRTVLAGETYVGEATVLGRAFFAAYAPLTDDAGRVLGVLYVGLPKAA